MSRFTAFAVAVFVAAVTIPAVRAATIPVQCGVVYMPGTSASVAIGMGKNFDIKLSSINDGAACRYTPTPTKVKYTLTITMGARTVLLREEKMAGGPSNFKFSLSAGEIQMLSPYVGKQLSLKFHADYINSNTNQALFAVNWPKTSTYYNGFPLTVRGNSPVPTPPPTKPPTPPTYPGCKVSVKLSKTSYKCNRIIGVFRSAITYTARACRSTYSLNVWRFYNSRTRKTYTFKSSSSYFLLRPYKSRMPMGSYTLSMTAYRRFGKSVAYGTAKASVKISMTGREDSEDEKAALRDGAEEGQLVANDAVPAGQEEVEQKEDRTVAIVAASAGVVAAVVAAVAVVVLRRKPQPAVDESVEAHEELVASA